jgi:hypothetical protein
MNRACLAAFAVIGTVIAPASCSTSSTTPAPAPTSVEIRATNWSEIALPVGSCGSTGPVALHAGIAKVIPPGGYRGFAQVTVILGDISTPVYGDLRGDGRMVAAVDLTCDTGGGTGGSGLGDTLLVYALAPDGHLQLLGQLPSTHPNADSPTTGFFTDITIVKGTITADEHYYNPSDPLANPTGIEHHLWKWTSGGLEKSPS